MKNKISVLLNLSCLLLCLSCDLLKKEDSSTLGGTQSPLGNVGVTVSSGSVAIAGASDFSYGMLLIKTIQVESVPNYLKSANAGVTKIKYIANHKFGLVGVMVSFDDGTSATFPVYSSTQNS